MQPAPHSVDDTRQRLVAAALTEFARKGVEATSIRALNRAAQARHQSAVYYHFGDKWGLVEAVLDFAVTGMLAQQREALSQLAEQSAIPVARIVQALVEPSLKMAASAQGRERLLFVARLSDEMGDRGQRLVAARVRPVAALAEQLLQRALPQLTQRALSIKLRYAYNVLLHTLADRGMQQHWELGAVSNTELVAQLQDFLEGGLRFAAEQSQS